MANKKLKYEKPQSVDIGKAASVLGETCSGNGVGAVDGCKSVGNDAGVVPECRPDGGTATGPCYAGGTAGYSCNGGNNPAW